MKKTMIYLPETQHDRLTRVARERGSSLAGVIREAVARYLEEQPCRPRPRFIASGAGPEGDNASERVDEILRASLRDPD